MQTPDITEDDAGRFDNVLPAQVQLTDYLAIDDSVVVADKPRDDEIIRDALRDYGHVSDVGAPCEEPPPRRTMREAMEALVALEKLATPPTVREP